MKSSIFFIFFKKKLDPASSTESTESYSYNTVPLRYCSAICLYSSACSATASLRNLFGCIYRVPSWISFVILQAFYPIVLMVCYPISSAYIITLIEGCQALVEKLLLP